MRIPYATPVLAGVTLMLAVTFTHGQSFSVTPGWFAPGDDVFNPGPIPSLPGAGLEVDAFSYGHTTDFGITDVQFSVDTLPSGIPGTAVFAESGFGDQSADIYNSPFGSGFNTQLWDGDGIPSPGLAPALGVPEIPGLSDVDGWDNRLSSAADIYFSMDPATAPIIGAFPADVFIAPAIPGYPFAAVPYAPSFTLGLDVFGPGTDDIDALVAFDHSGIPGVFDAADYILFSLTPGSLTVLTGGGPLYPGATAGDVLIATAGGGTGVFLPGIALGLTPGDNLNALDVIPEPSAILLLFVGGGGLYIKRRWFSC